MRKDLIFTNFFKFYCKMLPNELVVIFFVEGKNNEPREKVSITLYLCWDEGFLGGK